MTAETFAEESRARPVALAGRKTFPGMAAVLVFDVRTTTMVVFTRLALNASAWTTRTGRRLAGILPRGPPRSAQ
jgi:hypothetical protein